MAATTPSRMLMSRGTFQNPGFAFRSRSARMTLILNSRSSWPDMGIVASSSRQGFHEGSTRCEQGSARRHATQRERPRRQADVLPFAIMVGPFDRCPLWLAAASAVRLLMASSSCAGADPRRSRKPAAPAWQVSAALAGLSCWKAGDSHRCPRYRFGASRQANQGLHSPAQEFGGLSKRITHQAEDSRPLIRLCGLSICRLPQGRAIAHAG